MPKVTQLELEPRLSGSSLCPLIHPPQGIGEVAVLCEEGPRGRAVGPTGILEKHRLSQRVTELLHNFALIIISFST